MRGRAGGFAAFSRRKGGRVVSDQGLEWRLHYRESGLVKEPENENWT